MDSNGAPTLDSVYECLDRLRSGLVQVDPVVIEQAIPELDRLRDGLNPADAAALRRKVRVLAALANGTMALCAGYLAEIRPAGSAYTAQGAAPASPPVESVRIEV